MEHVIPQWLIECTGDPNRKVQFGVNLETGKLMQYSFNDFMFPACRSCNITFSTLESKAKSIITDVLREKSLAAISLNTLFTWFDKVRIGLWLAYLVLNKNRYGIEPHFYIQQRMDANDRMLLVYKCSDNTKGIQFIGVNLPFFSFVPSCFSLAINQFYFINISADFLFSRRLGLPSPKEMFLQNDGKIGITMEMGLKRVLLPLVRCSYDQNCTEIYQPIIKPEIFNSGLGLYKNHYAKKYFHGFSSPIGKVLIKHKDNIRDYSKMAGEAWIPQKVFERNKLSKIVTTQVINFQNHLLNNIGNLDELNFEIKRFWKRFIPQCKKFNKRMLERIDKEGLSEKHRRENRKIRKIM
jgi:ribosomal protein L44E